ncbi:uncharacterized protein LOC135823405 [Sycon ciliatum]|uniref:uncharacterized protein LOC135823405 n=1 Tax=Sycon ciliatum TaxID=27933 RepID=UPI0031F64939
MENVSSEARDTMEARPRARSRSHTSVSRQDHSLSPRPLPATLTAPTMERPSTVTGVDKQRHAVPTAPHYQGAAARPLPALPPSPPPQPPPPPPTTQQSEERSTSESVKRSLERITSKLLLLAETHPGVFMTRHSLAPFRHLLVLLGDSCEDAEVVLGNNVTRFTGPNAGQNLKCIIQPVLLRWKNSHHRTLSTMDPYEEIMAYLDNCQLGEVMSELQNGKLVLSSQHVPVPYYESSSVIRQELHTEHQINDEQQDSGYGCGTVSALKETSRGKPEPTYT